MFNKRCICWYKRNYNVIKMHGTNIKNDVVTYTFLTVVLHKHYKYHQHSQRHLPFYMSNTSINNIHKDISHFYHNSKQTLFSGSSYFRNYCLG